MLVRNKQRSRAAGSWNLDWAPYLKDAILKDEWVFRRMAIQGFGIEQR